MFNTSKGVLLCGKIMELFSTQNQYSIHSNPRVNSTLWTKDRLRLLAVSLVFSQPPDEAMQLATHVQDIYGHASLHRKNEEAAGSCASMLAMPIVVVIARIEMYLFLKCSKARQRGTSTSNCYSDRVIVDWECTSSWSAPKLGRTKYK